MPSARLAQTEDGSLGERRQGPVLAAAVAALACACTPAPPAAWSGYVEGDYVYVSAPIGGTLVALSVQAGQDVKRGAALFALDPEPEQAARDEALARLASARAEAADADKGRRPDEIAVTSGQLAQARAAEMLARSELARAQELLVQRFVSEARVDDARSSFAQAQARVRELEAAERVTRLPARADTRSAAAARAEAAQQALRQSEWRERQTRALAPADAQVADTYFRPGEVVTAGQPVVALLPPPNVKARFFVPEAEIATLAAGQAVALSCDGCGAPIAARVTHIATRAEYTPPVIYSNVQRAKLVFLVEARPAPADAPRLRPGQPLDVRRAAAAP